MDTDIVLKRKVALQKFARRMEEISTSKGAQEYGYTAEAIFKALGPVAAGYAIAEKGIRYAKKSNTDDLVKAAVYAFLEWSTYEAAQNNAG